MPHILPGSRLDPASRLTAGDGFPEDGRPLADVAGRYLAKLLQADRAGATRLIMELAEGGTPIKDIYLHVFQASQHELGRLWQINQINVAQEHYCTAATQLIMAQLYPYVFGGDRCGRRLVAACVGGELHELGVRMVADFFEMAGWDAYYLGANCPLESILASVRDRRADILAISATLTSHVPAVAELIRAIRASEAAETARILAGGWPFQLDPELWREVGADGWARDAEEAVAVAVALCG